MFMKQLFFTLYAAVFHLCRIFPVQKKRVALISMHNAGFHDSLGEMERAFREQNEGFFFVKITRKDLSLQTDAGVSALVRSILRAIGFFTVKAYGLARSKYIFLNDNFMPLASLRLSKKAVVTQLWHAEGAFKRFGQDIDQPPEIRAREAAGNAKLSFVVCSSESVAPHYASAFHVNREQVLPLGSPRTDFFFRPHDLVALRARFDESYPQCRGKKLVLYAPTFRDDPDQDRDLLSRLDTGLFTRHLGEEYALLVRLHPQVHADTRTLTGAVDLTSYPDVSELVLLCDVLVTDYSSIVMDFALLRKRCIFYAFDLEEYERDRPFYFDYETFVPGKIVRTMPELVDEIEYGILDLARLEQFRAFHFGRPDGNAARRVAEYVERVSCGPEKHL